MSYKFDHEWEGERKRLQRLELGMDPGTIRALEKIGVRPGWQCLEVGGGAGSIAAWLTDKVRLPGSVVATDLQTGYMESLGLPDLTIKQHDIARDPLEEDAFDLIHSRAVLEHLPDREATLDKLVAAVKPGGWLLLECHDFTSLRHVSGGDPEVFAAAVSGLIGVMAEAGFDSDYGRFIGHALRQRGLSRVVTEARAYELGGERPLTGALTLALKRLADPICASGQVTADALANLIDQLEGGVISAMSPTIVASWGQKPEKQEAAG